MTTTNEPAVSVLGAGQLHADLSAAMVPKPLTAHLLERIDRYWRAANYLSVGRWWSGTGVRLPGRTSSMCI